VTSGGLRRERGCKTSSYSPGEPQWRLHPSAKAIPYTRELLVERVLRLGWAVDGTVQAAGVSVRTVHRGCRKFREDGRSGLPDRPCRPRRVPRRIPIPRERQVEKLRGGRGRTTGAFYVR